MSSWGSLHIPQPTIVATNPKTAMTIFLTFNGGSSISVNSNDLKKFLSTRYISVNYPKTRRLLNQFFVSDILSPEA